MKFGWKKQTFSSKDFNFSILKPTLRSLGAIQKEHVITEYTPISNQYNIGSCVANATVDAFEILMGHSGNVVQLSRLFVYWNARNYIQETDKDNGSYIRDAFNSLKRLGVCREDVWVYDTGKVFKQPNIMAFQEASDNKVTSYYSIQSNGDQLVKDIKTALLANHPVVFGTDVSKEFQNNSSLIYDIPNNSVGGHAMIIVGFREDEEQTEFLIRNSWGEGWGDKGHCWFTEDYIKWGNTSDFWVPTLIEDLVI